MLLARYGFPLAIGLAALLGPATAGYSTTVLPLTLRELVAKADRIIVGDVVDVRCEWDHTRDGRVPVTLVTIRTLRTLKGAAGVQLVLEFLGGTVDDDTLQVINLPLFRVGDRDVLFLKGGGQSVSPLVGVIHGRFRVAWNATLRAESVATHDGRPLVDGDLFQSPPTPLDRTRPLSLESLEREILNCVRQPGGGALVRGGLSALSDDPADSTTTVGRTAGYVSSAPATIQVALGSSPALLNGCADWACVADKALHAWHPLLEPAQHPAIVVEPLERPVTDGGVNLTWAHMVYGRPLDDDALAVTVRRTNRQGQRVVVAFNRFHSWNGYDGPTLRSHTGEPLFDLQRVLTRELAHLFGAEATVVLEPSSDNTAPARSREADDPRDMVERTALEGRTIGDARQGPSAGCGAGATPGVLVDPKLLVFESPDDPMMTGYQVGIFPSRAASPARVVDLPPGAVVHQPMLGLAVTGSQRAFVVHIRAAGLITPFGVHNTYRVRGVWSGGWTEWSEPSQQFVSCTLTQAP